MQTSNYISLAVRYGLRLPSLALMPPALLALLTQCGALLLAILIAFAIPELASGLTLSPLQWALLQGVIATAIGHRLGMAAWWLPLHLVFAPALVAALALAVSPLWFFGGFVLLALVYGKTYQTQVPLYLSSRAAAQAVASLLPQRPGFSFLDLGSGCGGLLHHVGKVRPDGNYHGVEAAPLPFLFSLCRNLVEANGCRIRWGNFWNRDLAPYDVVYAYLSPAPMAALWRKARAEMRPGSIFISNSFAIPGVTPQHSLELKDFGGSVLHLWRM